MMTSDLFALWAFPSPGIIVIRWAVPGHLKREAERRAAQGG